MASEDGVVYIELGSDISFYRVNSYLDTVTVSKIKQLTSHQDPNHFKNLRLGRYSPGSGKIDTSKYFKNTDNLRIPRGLFSKMRDIVHGAGYKIRVKDSRIDSVIDYEEFPEYRDLIPLSLHDGIDLWDYQLDLERAIIGTENCLVRGGCGSGKTEVGISFFKKVRRNTLVIVWSKNLFDQWIKRVSLRCGLKIRDIGIISSSKINLKPVTIASQQTLFSRLKNKDFRDVVTSFFGAIIADEVQAFAAPTLFGVIEPFPARYRVGISEDETRKDGKEFLIYDLFGDVREEISTEYLESIGVVHKVPIYVVPTDLTCEKYERPDFVCNKPVWRRGCGETFPYGSTIVENENSANPVTRQMIEGDSCPNCGGVLVQIKDYDNLLKESLMADENRMNAIRDIVVQEHEDDHIISVFSDRLEYCQALSDLIRHSGVRNGLIVGDVKYKGQRKAVLDYLVKGDTRVIIGTKTIYQGFDFPPLDRGIVSIPKGSNRQLFSQQIGRLRRPERICRKCNEKIVQTNEDVLNGTCPKKCPYCGSIHKYDAKMYYIWDKNLFPKHLINIGRWFKEVYVLREGEWIPFRKYVER